MTDRETPEFPVDDDPITVDSLPEAATKPSLRTRIKGWPLWVKIVVPISALAILAAVWWTATTLSRPPESAYFSVARAMPSYSDLSDAQLRKAGHSICGIFRLAPAAGTDGWATSVKAIAYTPDDWPQADIIVKGAVAVYCPEYRDKIPKLGTAG